MHLYSSFICLTVIITDTYTHTKVEVGEKTEIVRGEVIQAAADMRAIQSMLGKKRDPSTSGACTDCDVPGVRSAATTHYFDSKDGKDERLWTDHDARAINDERKQGEEVFDSEDKQSKIKVRHTR